MLGFYEFIFLVLVLIAGFYLFILPAYYSSEGFQAGMPGVRCGVDLSTCKPGLQCINGFCSTSKKPSLLANELPVYP